jgi:DNA-binding NarL/FixJ family response regulator
MPVRVLIVDDDKSFRDAIGRVLAGRGYDVVGEAGTLAQARATITEVRPDAVLLDVNLPDGNGVAFAEELSASGHGPRIVLTSSDSAAASPRRVERSGAAAFVAKTDLIVTDLTRHLG